MSALAFMSFGLTEMLVVAVVALLVFGGKLPDVMRQMGRAYARLRGSLSEFSAPVRQEFRRVTDLSPPRTPPVTHAAHPEAAPQAPEGLPSPPAPTPSVLSVPSTHSTPSPRAVRTGAADEPPPV